MDFERRKMELQVEQASLLARRRPVLDGICRVCIWAHQHDALVLTMIVH